VLHAGVGRERRAVAATPSSASSPSSASCAGPRDHHHRSKKVSRRRATSSPNCAARSAATSPRASRGCRPLRRRGGLLFLRRRPPDRTPAELPRTNSAYPTPPALLRRVLAFDHVRKESGWCHADVTAASARAPGAEYDKAVRVSTASKSASPAVPKMAVSRVMASSSEAPHGEEGLPCRRRARQGVSGGDIFRSCLHSASMWTRGR